MPVHSMWTWSGAVFVVEAVAMVAFAASGILAAERKHLDIVGVCVVTGLTAFGGGTLRDLLIDRRPFFWVAHPGWLWAVMAFAIAAMLLLRARHLEATERLIQWPDALGLGLFAASGTQLALDARLPAVVAVLMGTVTAVFGGVLRDIVCNEIPSVFRGNRPYAVCAFAGGWVLVLADQLGASDWTALIAGSATATLLRAAALTTDFTLPGWRSRGD